MGIDTTVPSAYGQMKASRIEEDRWPRMRVAMMSGDHFISGAHPLRDARSGIVYTRLKTDFPVRQGRCWASASFPVDGRRRGTGMDTERGKRSGLGGAIESVSCVSCKADGRERTLQLC